MKQEFNYVIEGKEWKELQDAAYVKVSKNVKVDGFRPGKAPRDMYEKKYGKQDILFEAADMAVKKEYERLLKEEKLMPVIEPKIDLVGCTDDKLEVKFVFVMEPTVELGEYKNLGVKKEKIKVTKEEINKRIDSLLESYAEIMTKDGDTVESGDTAVIDFTGYKDGVPFEGGKSENYSLVIGSNTFIPGFEDAVKGMKRGEEKDINLTFPEDYMAEDLKGKEVVFKVKVNEIKTRVIPEMDKDFFSDLNMEGVTNKEELEHSVEHELMHQKEHEAEHIYEDKCLEKAAANMKVELCDELVNDEAEYMYKEFVDRLGMQGINEEMYLKYSNKTKEDIVNEMKKEAPKRLKYRYLLKAVIDAEKIKVSAKEVKDRIKEMANMYQVSEEDILKEVSEDNIKFDLTYQKALDVVMSNNEKETVK